MATFQRRLPTLFFLAMACPLALALHAGPVPALHRPGPPEGRVILEAPDGTETERRLEQFSSVNLRDVGAAWIRFADAVLLRGPASDTIALLELQTGDRIGGTIVDGDDEGVVLELVGGVRLALPIDSIRSFVFVGRLPDRGTALLAAADEGDRLYRLTGDNLDRIDGTIESFSEKGVRFESVLGSRMYGWSEVGALFIEPLGGGDEESETDGEAVVCDLIDGSRLRGQLIGVDRRGCRLNISGAGELLLPIPVLSEISLDDGSVAFLSDLVPSRVDEGSPFGDDLGMTWPHQMDRSVMGSILSASGRSYTRGIGVHAPSVLTFALDGKWNQLRGSVAIDDEVLRLHSRGSVIFRIRVDGKLAWESGVVRGGVPAIALAPVDLSNAKELVLECDMSTEFAVADRADWLRMVLVRQ